MRRHAFALQVNDGKMSDFRKNLGQVWEDLTAFLDEHNIKNFSLWNVEQIIFGYCELDDDIIFHESDKNLVAALEKRFGNSFTWISSPFEKMRLMYHDFGFVRESKELIRYRVFVTKLISGTQEEYKKRHDTLIKKRGNRLTEGPDSNFSIWNAGDYIFGYDEIDITMEHEMTVSEKEKIIQWEKYMLEIMTWLTNDVDWITGEHHPGIQRICWHN